MDGTISAAAAATIHENDALQRLIPDPGPAIASRGAFQTVLSASGLPKEGIDAGAGSSVEAAADCLSRLRALVGPPAEIAPETQLFGLDLTC
jgi:hypothetical protein